MTVKELITALQKFPNQEADVRLGLSWDDDSGTSDPAETIRLEDYEHTCTLDSRMNGMSGILSVTENFNDD